MFIAAWKTGWDLKIKKKYSNSLPGHGWLLKIFNKKATGSISGGFKNSPPVPEYGYGDVD